MSCVNYISKELKQAHTNTHTQLLHTHLPNHSILLSLPELCICSKKRSNHTHVCILWQRCHCNAGRIFKINVDVSIGYPFWKKLDLDPKFTPHTKINAVLIAYLIENGKTTKYSEESRKISSGLWRRQTFLKQDGKINNHKWF